MNLPVRFTTKKVHISQLRIGDTVIIDGIMETVGSKHITKSDFFGYQYKGYCHYETQGMLDVVIFPRWYEGRLVHQN
jgi:hypothetical protein